MGREREKSVGAERKVSSPLLIEGGSGCGGNPHREGGTPLGTGRPLRASSQEGGGGGSGAQGGSRGRAPLVVRKTLGKGKSLTPGIWRGAGPTKLKAWVVEKLIYRVRGNGHRSKGLLDWPMKKVVLNWFGEISTDSLPNALKPVRNCQRKPSC